MEFTLNLQARLMLTWKMDVLEWSLVGIPGPGFWNSAQHYHQNLRDFKGPKNKRQKKALWERVLYVGSSCFFLWKQQAVGMGNSD